MRNCNSNTSTHHNITEILKGKINTFKCECLIERKEIERQKMSGWTVKSQALAKRKDPYGIWGRIGTRKRKTKQIWALGMAFNTDDSMN